MGNFEKLVVMTILFLTMLVLAVTFHKGEPGDTGSPLDQVALAGGPSGSGAAEPAAPPAVPRPTAPRSGTDRVERPAGGQSPAGLLSSSVREDRSPEPRVASPVAPPLVAASNGRTPLIRDWSGLEAGRVDDYCYYTARPGDSFESIAARVYGDAQGAVLLRLANEELSAPQPGERMFVPVFATPDAPRERATPVRGSRVAGGAQKPPLSRPAPVRDETTKPVVAEAAPQGTAATQYVVQGGDTLSEISSEVYGTSRRYLEIYEANRDQLASPDVLAEGMVLYIPR